MKSILIVGAGLTGCTIARILADAGYEVTIIDRRNHIAGNAYDFENEFGIVQHKYGPHLFHTSNSKVVDFLSRFTDWTPYQHKVKAMLEDGQLVTLPVNRETARIVGKENIIDTFYRPYSEKMWGMPLEQISPEILNRVKIRDDDNELYFPEDTFQMLPSEGYTALCERMTTSARIKCVLNKECEEAELHLYDHVFHTGPIDAFFEFRFGRLPYRSLKFFSQHLPASKIFPVAQVNFTHTGPYTRATEWKNIPNHGTNDAWTTLTFEMPCDYTENNEERYYPVKDKDGTHRRVYMKYKRFAETNHPKITFCGRLGNYAYLDMHQAINSAMKLAQDFLTHPGQGPLTSLNT